MNRLAGVAITATVLGALSAPAHAAFTVTGQQRVVYAYTTTDTVAVGLVGLPPPAGADVKSAPDLGAFNQTASMSTPADAGTSSASATQNSTYDPATATFAVSGTVTGADQQNAGGYAVAYSTSIIDFTLTSPTETRVSAFGNLSNRSSTTLNAFLLSLVEVPSNTTYVNQNMFPVQSGASGFFTVSPVLPAGSYRFTVVNFAGGAGAGTPGNTMTFTAGIVIPAPAGAAAVFAAAGALARCRRPAR